MRPSTLHYFSEKKSFCPLHIDDYALFGQTFVKAAGYCDLDSDRKMQLPIEDNCIFSEMAEKHQVDKSIDELVDIRDVKLDSSLGQAERIQSFLQQIKNPFIIGRNCVNNLLK